MREEHERVSMKLISRWKSYQSNGIFFTNF